MARQDVIEARRSRIASLLTRGLSQREIHKAISTPTQTPGGVIKPFLNSKGKPFSLATVNRDIQIIRKEWRDKRDEDVEAWVSDELHLLNEVQKTAWSKGDYKAVLSVHQSRVHLLGLDAMTQAKIRDIDHAIMLSDEVWTALKDMGLTPMDVTAEFEKLVLEMAARG